MYFSELFSPELLRAKLENDLEISGNSVTQKCGHPDFCYIVDQMLILFWGILGAALDLKSNFTSEMTCRTRVAQLKDTSFLHIGRLYLQLLML